jgi:hypothetical protein
VQVKGQGYQIIYEPASATVFFRGLMRLHSAAEYAQIQEVMDQASASASPTITLDLSELEYLNSLGLGRLHGFTSQWCEDENKHIIVRGNSSVLWQARALKNLFKARPSIQLDWVDAPTKPSKE